jgi:ABC1 family protein
MLSNRTPHRSMELMQSTLDSRLGDSSHSLSSQKKFASSAFVLSILENLYSSDRDKNHPPPVFQELQKSVGEKKHSLKNAFLNIDPKERQALQDKIGPGTFEALLSISQESDPQLFAEAVLNIGKYLKKKLDEARAGLIFQMLGQEAIPAKVREEAKAEYDAMVGQGATGLRVEHLGNRFFKDAIDYKTIVPMLGSTALFSLVRTAAAAKLAASGAGIISQGLGLKIASAFIGSAVEIPAFALSGRALHQLAGDQVRESVSDDLLSSGITLTLLKGFGFAGNKAFQHLHQVNELGLATRLAGLSKFTQPLLSQSFMFGALLTGHKAEEKAGLRAHVDNATTITDTLASMVSMGVGGHLGHQALGSGYAKFQHELEFRSQNAESNIEHRTSDIDAKNKIDVLSSKFDVRERDALSSMFNVRKQPALASMAALGTGLATFFGTDLLQAATQLGHVATQHEGTGLTASIAALTTGLLGMVVGFERLAAKKGSKVPGKTSASPRIPKDFKKFETLFRSGISGTEDLQDAFEFLKVLHPRWNRMIRALERLKEERDTKQKQGDLKYYDEPFQVKLNSDGTYSFRSGDFHDRRRQLANGISLQTGDSVFALFHELTHALPIEDLIPELSALPYQGMEDLEDKKLSFEENYYHLLNHAYQDESISTLGEALLYRDMKAAGVPIDRLAPAHEIQGLQEILELYEKEGLVAYLQSELYIGRNHRSSYSQGRLIQMALLATLDPRMLQDPSLDSVLLEQGLKVEGGNKLAKHLQSLEGVLQKPTLENLHALLQQLRSDGVALQIDPQVFMSNVQEALALISGTKQKASASFLGRKEQTRRQVLMLGEVSRRFESYRKKLEDFYSTELLTDVEDGQPTLWEDHEGLVAFYRMTLQKMRGAEIEEKKALGELLQKVDRLLFHKMFQTDFARAVLDLERARWGGGDPKELKTKVRAALAQPIGYVHDNAIAKTLKNKKGEFYEATNKVKNLALRVLTEALQDPRVASCVDPQDFAKELHLSYDETFTKIPNLETEAEKGDLDALVRYAQSTSGFPGGGIIPHFHHQMGDEHITDWEVQVLQAAYAWSGLEQDLAKVYAGAGLFVYDPVEFAGRGRLFFHEMGDAARCLPFPFSYQRSLHRIRQGEEVDLEKTKRSQMDSKDEVIPTLFWLGEKLSYLPESISLYPEGPLANIPPGIVGEHAGNLPWVHLQLEVLERDPSLPAISKDIKEAVVVELLKEGLGLGWEDEFNDTGTYWVQTRLALRWARLAAGRGDFPWGQRLIKDVLEELRVNDQTNEKIGIRGGDFAQLRDVIREAGTGAELGAHIEYLELTQRVLAENPFGDTKKIKENLRSILQEYQTTVKLRRQGWTPAIMASVVAEWYRAPEFRSEMIQALQAAIEHTASFDIHSVPFRAGVKTLLQVIDEADLPHQTKEELLGKLLNGILPERVSFSGAQVSSRKKLEALDWFQKVLLSEEVLERLGLYPQAASLLWDRTQGFLAEIGNVPLSEEIEGQVIKLAGRLGKYMRRYHPEITDSANLPRLERVGEDGAYQLALADLFPSRKILVDASLPIEQWSPMVVRRGVKDKTAIWSRLQASLEGARQTANISDPDTFAQILKVLDAFVLKEIEDSGRKTNLVAEAEQLFEKFKKRSKERGLESVRDKLGAALTLYNQAQRLLSKEEQILLKNLTGLPPIAWAMAWTESAFAEGRSLAPTEAKIWETLLSAPTYSDAVRKRELYLLVLGDERFPLELRRRATIGLAHASQRGTVMENLIAGYRSKGDAAGEGRFYRLLAQYWQRIGQLPDEPGILFMEEYGSRDETGFWHDFDRVLEGRSNGGVTDLDLELWALKQGKLADRFLAEVETFLTSPEPDKEHLAFWEQLQRLLPSGIEERKALQAVIASVRRRRLDREDALEVLKTDLPAVFVQQSPGIRFLLLNFLKQMPQRHVQSLVRELRDLGETAGEAEVFKHFFLRTGLEKAGQFLSTMVGTIPEADRKTFADLQDKIPPSSWTEVKKSIEQELGRPIEEVFSTLEEEPVASASVGEVYRGTLKDGSEVYLKVSPPSKRAQIESAIQTLLKVAELYEGQKDRFDVPLDIPAQLRAFVQQLKDQLNFTLERRNALSIGGYRADEYQIPEFLIDLSTGRLTLMRPVSGVKITELAGAGPRSRAAAKYSADALRMLFRDGRYHGDPHPGNIFWDDAQNKLTWLDWGVTGSLQETERAQVFNLLMGVMTQDVDTQIRVLSEAGNGVSSEVLGSLRSELQKNSLQGSSSERLNQLLTMAGKHKYYIQPKLMQAVAFLLSVEGIVKDLDPEHDFAADVSKAY